MAFYQSVFVLTVFSFMNAIPSLVRLHYTGSSLHSQLSGWSIVLPVTVPHEAGPQSSAALPASCLSAPGCVSLGLPNLWW